MLSINLKGKKIFIAGIGDDQGFGWAIAKALAEAGARLFIGVWPPILKIFTTSLNGGKFDHSRKLSDGTLMNFEGIFPLDASFDNPEDIPEEIRENKRYKELDGYSISEVAAKISGEIGQLDGIVHSLANAPEIQKPLLETSRKGYLTAVGTSAYSLISLIHHFGPHLTPGGSVISLTYIAGEKVIPGYGGGMSSAKAVLESDTKTLAWEAGRKWGVRVNTISAGPLGSRAAKAIGFIDQMISYSHDNAPIKKDLLASEIGCTAAFLTSSLASAITGSVIYVDNGLNIMGVAMESSMKSIVLNEGKQ